MLCIIWVPFKVTTPHSVEGILNDPPPSVPRVRGTNPVNNHSLREIHFEEDIYSLYTPAATAAAEPLELPPV